MKNYLPINLYGAIIIFAGAFLLFSDYTTFDVLKLTLGISLTLGAVLSFIGALSNRENKAAFAYHEMHALAMFVYGLSVLFFSKSLETLTSITAFLFIFYSFSEIIFCLRIFDLKSKVLFKIVIVRSLLGLAVGIGTIVAMNLSDVTLKGFGILFIIVGINIALYVPIIKGKEFNKG
jgi:uncharacterized membrane protein HdeD (DUF308 family)